MANTEAHTVFKVTIEDSSSAVVYTTKMHIPDQLDQVKNGFHGGNYGICDSSHNESGERAWTTQNGLQNPIFWYCVNPAGRDVLRMKKTASEASVAECELPKTAGQTNMVEFAMGDEKCKMKIENEGENAGPHGCMLRSSKEYTIRTNLG